MGWSETKWGAWGDATQDLVDNYLDELVGGKLHRGVGYFLDEKQHLRKKLVKSKKLRQEFDKIFQETFSRRGTTKEFTHHIDVAVGLEHTGVLREEDR